MHPRHRKICWEGAGGGVGEFGKVRAPQTQKKYVGERREGGGVGDKRRGSGKRGVWRETWVSRAIKKMFLNWP